MQQIVQGNPKYQEALQGDERFQALMENCGKNLQQSVAQEQNKMIGLIGVQPMNLAMTEEERKKHLQQLGGASAIWQALKEVLDEATEMSAASAISDGVDSDDRHWRAGYAQAVTDVMGTLNRYRKV